MILKIVFMIFMNIIDFKNFKVPLLEQEKIKIKFQIVQL
jgi:hypothetical protein